MLRDCLDVLEMIAQMGDQQLQGQRIIDGIKRRITEAVESYRHWGARPEEQQRYIEFARRIVARIPQLAPLAISALYEMCPEPPTATGERAPTQSDKPPPVAPSRDKTPPVAPRRPKGP